jgi:hypothetical protein
MQAFLRFLSQRRGDQGKWLRMRNLQVEPRNPNASGEKGIGGLVDWWIDGLVD